MTASSPRASAAAGRAICAVWLGLALAALAPLLVWLDRGLIELAVVPHALLQGEPHAITPLARLVGVVATAIPSALLAWGLLGLLPALRQLREGVAITGETGRAVARLGIAVGLVGAYEPIGRAVLRVALTMGAMLGQLNIAVGLSASGVLLVTLGLTLVALGHVLRDAAAAVAENEGFV